MLLAFFLFSTPSFAKTLKIGIFDTGICLSGLGKLPTNVQVHPNYDATTLVKLVCKKDFSVNDRRYHGHFVTKELLKHLEAPSPIEIFPIIVFDHKGSQQISYWQEALKFAQKQKLDILLMAVGHPYHGKIPPLVLPTTTFVASGHVGGRINRMTKLWPQQMAAHPKLIMIGSFYPESGKVEGQYNSSLLYQNKIDYYFSQGADQEEFKGSSRAVAYALAQALKICQGQKDIKDCLEKKRRPLKLIDTKNKHYTY